MPLQQTTGLKNRSQRPRDLGLIVELSPRVSPLDMDVARQMGRARLNQHPVAPQMTNQWAISLVVSLHQVTHHLVKQLQRVRNTAGAGAVDTGGTGMEKRLVPSQCRVRRAGRLTLLAMALAPQPLQSLHLRQALELWTVLPVYLPGAVCGLRQGHEAEQNHTTGMTAMDAKGCFESLVLI